MGTYEVRIEVNDLKGNVIFKYTIPCREHLSLDKARHEGEKILDCFVGHKRRIYVYDIRVIREDGQIVSGCSGSFKGGLK